MLGSYSGMALWVDLTKEKIERKPLPEQYLIHLGGKALAARLLFDNVPAGTQPLSEENALIFTVGPLNGTSAMLAAKCSVATKSPLTNGYLDCTMGGYWGAELKNTGLDAIIIKGRAKEPSYLVVNNEDVYIGKAIHPIWGSNVYEAEAALKDELGTGYQIASIGIAGEKHVKLANISHDLYRQAGRGGAGAVMGSKNLKAIAVFGSKGVSVSDPKKFEEINKDFFDEAMKKRQQGEAWSDSVNRYGTSMFVEPMNEHGILPTRNFQQGSFEDWEKISGYSLRKEIWTKSRGCHCCPLACGNFVRMSKRCRGSVVGPEYETIFAFGSNCGINDIEAIAKFNELCDEYGIDTISTGSVIAFAMECYEKGYIGRSDTDGLDVRFGNVETVYELIEKIGNKTGIGALLGEGVRSFSKKISIADAQNFSMHVKGLELPGYDPRGVVGMALAYATSDRGACHLRAWTPMEEIYGNLDPFTTEGKAELVKIREQRKCIMDSLIICDMLGLNPKYADLVQAATGQEISVIPSKKYPQLLEDFVLTYEGRKYPVGEIQVNIARIFNLREGFNRFDDTLPERLFTEALKDGPPKGRCVPRDGFNRMLEEYYQLRGWDSNGIPMRTKLEELGIYEVVSGSF